MHERGKTSRRGFVGLCASTVTAGALAARASAVDAAATQATYRSYHRVRMVDAQGRPLRTTDLVVGENYLFHYPFVSTPCFLIDLGQATEEPSELTTEANETYRWRAGVGQRKSVVAFSAICAHKMSHPARSISFINYRHEPVRFRKLDYQSEERDRVIYCCSEKSVYDPAAGGRVIGGPAPQPLAGIVLEHNPADDSLHATGTFGGDMFHRFFDKFGHRLQIEYGLSEIQAQVTGISRVVPITEFCAKRVLCGRAGN